jgi:nucleotide-binding universal stress UspA family protein
MSDYSRVLIPIDLTPARQAMAPAVRRIVDTRNAEITLLHVVESQPWVGRAGHTLRLLSELEMLAQRRFRGARLVRRIEWGRPADCILNVVRTGGADLVLMAAAGGSLRSDPLGEVAREVLAEACCPVLLEWPTVAPVNHARVQPVCCAVEWDGNEAHLLRAAVRAAERCGAPLILLSAAGWREGEAEVLRSRARELSGELAPEAEVRIEAGNLTAVIGRALRFHGAGLLVAGGSREVLLAAERECPVLYVGSAKAEVPARAEFADRRIA